MFAILLLLAAIFVLLVYRILAKINKASIARLVIFAAAIFLFYTNSYEMLLGILGLILFDIVSAEYGKSSIFLFALLGIVYVSFMLLQGMAFLGSQALLLGLLSDTKILKEIKSKQSKHVEVRRDLVQILIGIVFVVVLYLFSVEVSTYIFAVLVILGYILINYTLILPSAKLSKYLYALEREKTRFGEGAVYLALGTLIAVSFIHVKALMLLVFVAIFFSDSIATIIGVNFGRVKLPYNRRKSVIGTLAYFLVLLVPAFFVIGPLSIAVALIAALAESASNRIDDNLAVPAVLAFLFIALRSLL